MRSIFLSTRPEKALFFPPTIYHIIGLLLFICSILLIYKFLSNLSERAIFIMITIINLSLGLYITYNTFPHVGNDPGVVLSIAKEFNEENYAAIVNQNGYIFSYPYQLGLVSCHRIILFLFGGFYSDTILFLIHLVISVFNIFLLWQVSELLFNSKKINKLALLMSGLFFPQLLYFYYIYNGQPGLFFLLLSFYFLVKYLKTSSLFNLIIFLLSSAVSSVLRSNYLIFIIAVCLILLLITLKRRKIFFLLMIFLLFFSLFGLKVSLNSFYEKEIKHPLPIGIPSISWVTMGISPPTFRSAGYYNRYTVDTFEKNNYNTQKTKDQSIKDLRLRLNYFIDHPKVMKKFFTEKLDATWFDPTFESLWIGPSKDNFKDKSNILLNSLYNNGPLSRHLNFFGTIYLMFVYSFTFLGLLLSFCTKRYKDLSPEYYCFHIYFIGVFIFHLFWETKSQYVYQAVFLLIPLLSYYLDWLFSYKKKNT